MRRDPFLRPPVHLDRPDLHLERHPVLADDRGVARLYRSGEAIAMKSLMRPGTGDHVWWIDTQRRVTSLTSSVMMRPAR